MLDPGATAASAWKFAFPEFDVVGCSFDLSGLPGCLSPGDPFHLLWGLAENPRAVRSRALGAFRTVGDFNTKSPVLTHRGIRYTVVKDPGNDER